jgi:hypothetical protein
MSIYNINTYYSGNDYGDYSNGTQSYTDYSVNEINGPCKVQVYTITDGVPVLPTGYTKFVKYIIKNQDVTVNYDEIFDELVAKGFDKNGQVLTFINSFESDHNIIITYPDPTNPTINLTATISPTNSFQLYLIYDQDGEPSAYGLGTLGGGGGIGNREAYGIILNKDDFSGSPYSALVDISGFVTINLSSFAINVTGTDARMWSVSVDNINNTFTINSNSNVALTGDVYCSLTRVFY